MADKVGAYPRECENVVTETYKAEIRRKQSPQGMTSAATTRRSCAEPQRWRAAEVARHGAAVTMTREERDPRRRRKPRRRWQRRARPTTTQEANEGGDAHDGANQQWQSGA